mgnify:CR=1 FL=1
MIDDNDNLNEEEKDELHRLLKKAGGNEEELGKVLHDKKRTAEAEAILQDEDKVDELIKKVIRSLDNIPLIGKFFADVPTLCLIVKDYVQGNYKEIPLATMAMLVVALVYFVSPIDLIPDVIPIIGQVDDAVVIAIAVGAAHNDLAKYKEWKGLDSDPINDLSDLIK